MAKLQRQKADWWLPGARGGSRIHYTGMREHYRGPEMFCNWTVVMNL